MTYEGTSIDTHEVQQQLALAVKRKGTQIHGRQQRLTRYYSAKFGCHYVYDGARFFTSVQLLTAQRCWEMSSALQSPRICGTSLGFCRCS